MNGKNLIIVNGLLVLIIKEVKKLLSKNLIEIVVSLWLLIGLLRFVMVYGWVIKRVIFSILLYYV